AKASVGSNDGVEAGDFAAALVGHAGLDAVARIELVRIQLGGDGDRQLAVGIELSRLLGKLFAGVVVAALTHVAFALGISAVAFIVVELDVGRPVHGAVHYVFHRGSGHGLAKVILGFDRRGDG